MRKIRVVKVGMVNVITSTKVVELFGNEREVIHALCEYLKNTTPQRIETISLLLDSGEWENLKLRNIRVGEKADLVQPVIDSVVDTISTIGAYFAGWYDMKLTSQVDMKASIK
jgi:hypothetical protein